MTTAYTLASLARDDWDGPGAWWPVFPLFWLLVVSAIVATVVLSRRRGLRTAGQRAGETKLAERYASGEITEQEYRERRVVLKEQSQ